MKKLWLLHFQFNIRYFKGFCEIIYIFCNYFYSVPVYWCMICINTTFLKNHAIKTAAIKTTAFGPGLCNSLQVILESKVGFNACSMSLNMFQKCIWSLCRWVALQLLSVCLQCWETLSQTRRSRHRCEYGLLSWRALCLGLRHSCCANTLISHEAKHALFSSVNTFFNGT